MKTAFILDDDDMALLKSGAPYEIRIGSGISYTMIYRKNGLLDAVLSSNGQPTPRRQARKRTTARRKKIAVRKAVSTNGSRKRKSPKSYSDKFKAKAVEQVKKGSTIWAVANSLNVGRSVLVHWVKQAGIDIKTLPTERKRARS